MQRRCEKIKTSRSRAGGQTPGELRAVKIWTSSHRKVISQLFYTIVFQILLTPLERKKERGAEKCIRPIASAEKFKIVDIILVIFLGFSFLANNENKICISSWITNKIWRIFRPQFWVYMYFHFLLLGGFWALISWLQILTPKPFYCIFRQA